MSGIATIAAISSAAIGAGSLAYGVVNGQAQQSAQAAALKNQTTAQQKAEGAALSNERKSEVAQGAANMATPDLAGIMKRAATVGTGLSSTMLTGAGGVNPGGLTLGSSTLLGS